MKRAWRVLIVTTSLCCVGGLVPGAAAGIDFSLLGSYWDTDNAGTSVGFGARLALLEGFQIELTASYFDDLDRTIEGSELGVVLEAIPIDLGLRLPLGRSFYVAAGGSLYLLEQDIGEGEDEYGYYVTLGVRGKKFFLEAQWRDVEGEVSGLDDFDNVGFQDGVVPVDLGGITFTLGYKF